MMSIKEILKNNDIDLLKYYLEALFKTWHANVTTFCDNECLGNNNCNKCSIRSITDALDEYVNGSSMNRALRDVKDVSPEAFEIIVKTIKSWHGLAFMDAYSKLRNEIEEAMKGLEQE